MLDWDRGLGTCQHCGEIIQLHTYQRKQMRNYIRPEQLGNTDLSSKVLKWFSDRCISQETLATMKVAEGLEYMADGETNTIQFNYFERGNLINIKYRDAKKNFKLVKDAERIFYNIDGAISNESIVIVEGEIDALSFIESGITNVVSVPTGANIKRNNLDYLDNCIDYFEDKSKIILALDNDEAGQILQQEFIRRFGAEVCYLASFGEHKDANEYLCSNGVDSLAAVVANAVPCPLENVQTVRDVYEELEDFVHNGFKPGHQIGLRSFDDIFSTYTGQFCVVTGIPSSGKSDFVDQMCVGYNRQYGWKTAYVSPENKPTYLHVHKLIRKFGDWNPKQDEIASDKWNQIVSHIDSNYYFIEMDRYDLDAVLAKGAELVKRKGINVFVIDPFNKVNMKGKSAMSIVDYTQEYLSKIEVFSRKYNVFTIVVAHPTKQYKNPNGEIPMPTMYDIKGGGEWYDMCPHGLIVHRNYEAKTVTVKVAKVKFQNLGTNQAEATFKWNSISGRYEELTTSNTNEIF